LNDNVHDTLTEDMTIDKILNSKFQRPALGLGILTALAAQAIMMTMPSSPHQAYKTTGSKAAVYHSIRALGNVIPWDRNLFQTKK